MSGKMAWKHFTGMPGGGGLIFDGTFVNGNWNKYISAFEIDTGKLLWRFDTGGQVESHPAYYDGVVFASTEQSHALYAIDAKTGKQIWKYDSPKQELNGSPSVTADTVYVGSNDHYLHAVDRKTGAFKFKVKTEANVFSSAAVADNGMVYVGSNTETGPVSAHGVGSLYAINPSKHLATAAGAP
jgi:outer membrane protein assembly factor BamB